MQRSMGSPNMILLTSPGSTGGVVMRRGVAITAETCSRFAQELAAAQLVGQQCPRPSADASQTLFPVPLVSPGPSNRAVHSSSAVSQQDVMFKGGGPRHRLRYSCGGHRTLDV